MTDVAEVLSLKTRLVGNESARHTHYDEMLDASHGNYYDRVMQSMWKKWEGIVYEPGSLKNGRRQVHIVINLLPQIVEAKRALWSAMPQIRVPYRSLDDTDVQMSDQLELAYRCLWDMCRMGEKLGDGGWYAAMLGTAVFAVYPDFIAHRPNIICRSPYGFYGVPGNIEQDGTIWKKVIFVTKMKGRQANTMWDNLGVSDDDLVDIIEYWDEETKMTIVEQNEKVVDGPVPNKLGIVPVVAVPNIAQPGQWWGKSDVDDAIPIINELNKRFNVENQAFSDQAGAPWEAISLEMEAEDVSLDPDAINTFSAGGGLKKSSTGGLPWQLYQSNQQILHYLDNVTDFPELMRSMLSGSNISGKAINNIMGPGVQARIELRQRYLYPRLQMLNKMAMTMWDAYWGGESHVLRGSVGGKRFNFEMRISDFEGYFENEVFLDSSAYFDMQSKVVVGLQMIAANGLSIKTFGEKLNPFVDDWTAEHAQIMKEQQERIQLAMMAQMMSQNPMGQNPNVGAPGKDQMGLEQGFQTSPQSMAPPPGVTPDTISQGAQSLEGPLSGPMGMGGETTPLMGGNDMLTGIADVVRSLTNLKGRVFLTGSILEGQPGPEGIEIWFTDMVDWATVRQALAKALPDTKGQLNPQQGIPSVEFLEITPGTSGYETQGSADLQAEGLPVPPSPMGAGPAPMGGGGEQMQVGPEVL